MEFIKGESPFSRHGDQISAYRLPLHLFSAWSLTLRLDEPSVLHAVNMGLSDEYEVDGAISDSNVTILCLPKSPSVQSLDASNYNLSWWEREASEVLYTSQDSVEQRLACWLLSHDADQLRPRKNHKRFEWKCRLSFN